MYLKLVDGRPEKYSIRQLRRDNPNVTFNVTSNEILAEWNVYPYTQPGFPDFDHLVETCIEGEFTKVDGKWVLPWVVERKPQEEAERNVRNLRNKLLTKSDWIIVFNIEKSTDIPVEWEVYRQALRDITSQEGFPYNVIWPTKPK